MAKRLLLVLVFSLAVTIVSANECYYKTETISENGVVKSVKEIKICEETTQLNNSFWYNLAYTSEGQKMFWDIVIFAFTMTQ